MTPIYFIKIDGVNRNNVFNYMRPSPVLHVCGALSALFVHVITNVKPKAILPGRRSQRDGPAQSCTQG